MKVTRSLAICFAVVLLPRASRAQTFELTPVVGMYTPMGLLVDGVDRTDNSRLRRRQLSALSTGARLGVRSDHVFGLETSLAFSPSQVAITDRSSTVDMGAPVAMASIRGVAKVSGHIASGRWSFHVAPGVGVVHRYGSAWRSIGATTDFAYVLAGGWRLGRFHSARAFLFDVEDYITRFRYQAVDAQASPRLHHDILWSFGLAIPME